MKKISKILLSLSMAFVMIFSLSGCKITEEPDESQDPLDIENYQAPVGVNMDSVSEYALWLLENADCTMPYIAVLSSIENYNNPTEMKLEILKYKYDNDIQKIARYNSSNQLKYYNEFEEIVYGKFKQSNYNTTSLTYTEQLLNEDKTIKSKANLYMADSVIALMWQLEMNQNYDIGDTVDYNELFGVANGADMEEIITNPSKGKYILTREIKVYNIPVAKYITTVINNRVTNLKIYSNIQDELLLTNEVGYEYKETSISIDKSLYTKAS